MKSHKHRLYGILIIIFIATFVTYNILSPQEFFFFKLDGLAITSGARQLDAVCHNKVNNILVDENNIGIRTEKSSFSTNIPTYSITATSDASSGANIGKFHGQVMMRCNVGLPDIGNNYQNCDDPAMPCIASNQAELIIEPSNLKVEVWSQNDKKEKIKTYETELTTLSPKIQVRTSTTSTASKITSIDYGVELADGKESMIVNWFTDIDDILKNMPNGKYKSYQEFRVSGDIRMHYKGYPKPQYVAHIPEFGMRTYVLLNVDNTISTLGGGDTGLTEQEVKDGQQLEGTQQTPNEEPKEQEENDGTNPLGLFEEFTVCLTTYDINCGLQQKFWGIYGLIIAGTAVALASSSRKTTPIPYGRT